MKLRIVLWLHVAVLAVIAGRTYASQVSKVPILVLATRDNFGLFTAEILKAEGFNEFRLDSIGNTGVTLRYLKQFDIVILAETPITAVQKVMLSDFVSQGGNLIAFKPDQTLQDIFGVTITSDALVDPYVAVDQQSHIGRGITSQTLQVHGNADGYISKQGTVVATLFETGGKSTPFPAVLINDYLKGHAIVFSYNLAKSVVLTRQGNYRLAGQETDGIAGIRAMDMFTGGWVDTLNNCINQTDEHMRLLTHSIEKLATYTKPLPRLWYFPYSLKCVATFNNDGEDSEEASFEKQFKDVDSLGAKMTLYIKETDLVSSAWVTKWINRGFEISGHPDDTKQATHPDFQTMNGVVRDLNQRLHDRYGIDGMHTVVNHWFVWCGITIDNKMDFATQARIEEVNGIELDGNYAHYDNLSNQEHFLGASGYNQGHFTGSGIPMKFSDVAGNIIQVYQHLNSVYDQQYMEHKDQDGYFGSFKGSVDRSLDSGVYSYVSVKAHNNEYFFSKKPLAQMIAYAKKRGVPIWTEIELLDFLKVKDETSFSDISWKSGVLSFRINSPHPQNSQFGCMVPATHGQRKIKQVSLNGKLQPVTLETIKGIAYAMVPINPGFAYAVKVYYE